MTYRLRMLRLFQLFLLLVALETALADEAAFNGRWIIEPLGQPPGRVMWLEVEGSGGDAIRGAAVGFAPGGQVEPLAEAEIRGDELYLTVRGRRRTETVVTESRARLDGGELHGVTEIDGQQVRWLGRRAPEIADRDDGSWKEGAPVALFDGDAEDLDNWRTLRPERDGDWRVEDGLLTNSSSSADVLVSRQEFWNFRLHVEYRAPQGSNSGIGLRGRYEIQILGDHGEPPSTHSNGAVYSRIAPTANATLPAEQWQTYDITLIGRQVTVVLNGRKVIPAAELEGFTAMATDWREGEPGPITLQGDHGKVEFRVIRVTPLERETQR